MHRYFLLDFLEVLLMEQVLLVYSQRRLHYFYCSQFLHHQSLQLFQPGVGH